jgi:serine/threonine protein kinase
LLQIDSKFRAKVADFGLANQKTKASGTVYWMSPELLQKKTCNTTASDVYAFGMIMYEIYSRKDPYHGEDPECVIRDIIDPAVDKRPPVPSSMKPCVSALMQECLVREPEERPTFDEIANRLKRFKADDVEPIGLVKRASGEKGEKNFDLLLKVG